MCFPNAILTTFRRLANDLAGGMFEVGNLASRTWISGNRGESYRMKDRRRAGERVEVADASSQSTTRTPGQSKRPCTDQTSAQKVTI